MAAELEMVISGQHISKKLPIDFSLFSSELGVVEFEYFISDYLIAVSRKKNWEITYKELFAICKERTAKGFFHTTDPYDRVVEVTAQELIDKGYFISLGIDNSTSSKIIEATEKLKHMIRNHNFVR